jgi:DNA polymerase-3 subunit delta
MGKLSFSIFKFTKKYYTVTAESIIKDIKKGNIAPVYFLYGEEPYYIDLISDFIEDHILDESQKEFNQLVLYGRDTQMDEVVAAARRYPMMSERQVIIVKEAQDLARSMDRLTPYLEAPQSATVLVLNYKYKKPDKRKQVFKLLSKVGVMFESKPLYENQVPAWIEKYVKERGYKIEVKSAVLMVEYLGNDLSRIAKELEKLELVLAPGDTITPELIEEHIGISKDYNNFELRRAIGQRDILKANRIIMYFEANPKTNPFVVTLASLQSFFTQLWLYHGLKSKSDKFAVARILGINPYFVDEYRKAAAQYPMRKVSRIISVLREYDLKSKGVGARDLALEDLLKEMLYKILH